MKKMALVFAVASSLTLSLAIPAQADVQRRGMCTGTSAWEADVDRDGSRYDLSFDIDTDEQGQQWTLTVTQNKKKIYTRTRTSDQDANEARADVSWDFVRRAATSGKNTFTFTAQNNETQERCSVSVRG